jgi:hypothetical protein
MQPRCSNSLLWRTQKQFAGLVGPTLAVLGVSEALNLHIWAVNIAPVTYLDGVLLFVVGLAIVRAHNFWTRSWPVSITLTDWHGFLLGLLRMFASKAQQGLQNTPAAAVYTINAVMIIVGLSLAAENKQSSLARLKLRAGTGGRGEGVRDAFDVRLIDSGSGRFASSRRTTLTNAASRLVEKTSTLRFAMLAKERASHWSRQPFVSLIFVLPRTPHVPFTG